jgi:hypothetical protein
VERGRGYGCISEDGELPKFSGSKASVRLFIRWSVASGAFGRHCGAADLDFVFFFPSGDAEQLKYKSSLARAYIYMQDTWIISFF